MGQEQGKIVAGGYSNDNAPYNPQHYNPHQNYQSQPPNHNQNAYGHPNQSAYGHPNQNAYGHPNQNAYGTPNQNAHEHPNQNAHGHPNQNTHAAHNQSNMTNNPNVHSGYGHTSEMPNGGRDSYLEAYHSTLHGDYGNKLNQSNLHPDYGRESRFTNLDEQAHMHSVMKDSVYHSRMNVPGHHSQSHIKNLSMAPISQQVYTKDLRQSQIEAERNKKAVEREYHSMVATGVERFITAKDLEAVIVQLEEKNNNLKHFEQDCK